VEKVRGVSYSVGSWRDATLEPHLLSEITCDLHSKGKTHKEVRTSLDEISARIKHQVQRSWSRKPRPLLCMSDHHDLQLGIGQPGGFRRMRAQSDQHRKASKLNVL
jgi:hypothetical protein